MNLRGKLNAPNPVLLKDIKKLNSRQWDFLKIGENYWKLKIEHKAFFGESAFLLYNISTVAIICDDMKAKNKIFATA